MPAERQAVQRPWGRDKLARVQGGAGTATEPVWLSRMTRVLGGAGPRAGAVGLGEPQKPP